VLATALFAPSTVHGTLQHIVDQAVVAVEGCDLAGIIVVRDQGADAVFSQPDDVGLDRLPGASAPLPCVGDADGPAVFAEDLFDERRWPAFTRAAAAQGIRSLLAFRLPAAPQGTLHLYARLPRAFGAVDRTQGLVFATLAGIALGTAEERASVDRRFDNLQEAVRSRELIGQAQGILMERERISADQAFDLLRRASQHLNRKLRDVAENVVSTGQVPTGQATPAAPERPSTA
jgi:hypothetical protein